MKAFRTISTFLPIVLLLTVASAQERQPPNSPNGSGAASGATPLLVTESFTHDFGEVKSGTKLRHAFKIKNEGKADLLINSVTPG